MNMRTEFELRSFTRARDIIGGTQKVWVVPG